MADDVLQFGREILHDEARALDALADSLDGPFEEAVRLILGCGGKLIVSGLGKSGHVARKIAATFASTGTTATFLHLAEAIHGDLGMAAKGDAAILISQSGETAELEPVIAMTGIAACRKWSTTGSSSAVSPLCEIRIAMSPALAMPRSPWIASARWRKVAVVPVEAKVAAILRATWPDLPRPLTINLPLQSRISRTASSNGTPRLSASASSARASSCRISRPNCSTSELMCAH